MMVLQYYQEYSQTNQYGKYGMQEGSISPQTAFHDSEASLSASNDDDGFTNCGCWLEVPLSLAPTQAPLKAPRPQAPFAPPLPPAEYKAGLARLPTQQRAVQNVVRSEVGIIDSIALLYSEPKFNTEPTTTTAVSRV